MNKKRKRRRFTKEFREDAVRLALGETMPMAQVARDLGIHPNTLYNWVNQQRAEHAGHASSGLAEDDRRELARLRRENRILKEERDILKKAAAFFATESR